MRNLTLTIPRTIATLLISFLLFCLSPYANAQNADNDVQLIQELNEKWAELYRNKDAGGMAALYSDDCVRIPNNNPVTKGREALEQAYIKEFSPIWKNNFLFETYVHDVVVSGDLATMRGKSVLTIDGKKSAGNWVAVLKRDPVKNWQFLWTTNNNIVD